MSNDREDYGKLVTLLENTGIIDNSYPVKGCCVWMPDGFDFKENVFSVAEREVKQLGYRRFQFPRLVPGNAIRKVTKGVANFEKGVFWLRSSEGEQFDIFLNPTGECAIYTMFNRWIRHPSDLPLRLYQIGSTFRPHRRPSVILNGDEFVSLLEAHSAFASKGEADTEFDRVSESFKRLHHRMGLPYLMLARPITGNKPVCTSMNSFETYLPSKRSSFNVGVVYNQGQIYSKAFNVEFSDQHGIRNFTHQVTFGISERSLAAMLDIHRDEHGLVMMPEFAPTQIEVIPVYGKSRNDLIDAYAREILDKLGDKYRVKLDDRNKSASIKMAEARMKGIPLRIGVSAADIEDRVCRVYIRDKEEPVLGLPISRLEQEIPVYLDSLSSNLMSRAQSKLSSKIVYTSDIDQTREAVSQGLMGRMFWCAKERCLNELGNLLPGELIGTDLGVNEKGACFICGEEASNPSYYAKRGDSP